MKTTNNVTLPPKRFLTRKRYRKWLRQILHRNPGMNPDYIKYETAPYEIAWVTIG